MLRCVLAAAKYYAVESLMAPVPVCPSNQNPNQLWNGCCLVVMFQTKIVGNTCPDRRRQVSPIFGRCRQVSGTLKMSQMHKPYPGPLNPTAQHHTTRSRSYTAPISAPSLCRCQERETPRTRPGAWSMPYKDQQSHPPSPVFFLPTPTVSRPVPRTSPGGCSNQLVTIHKVRAQRGIALAPMPRKRPLEPAPQSGP